MTAPEFSRPIRVDALPPRGRTFHIEATEAERVALARRFELLSLDALKAHLELRPVGAGQGFRLKGRLEAVLSQACVVTLDPLEARFDHEFALSFAPVEEEIADEIELAFEDEDPPESIDNGLIELGEAVVQVLATLIDPFPRTPGASLPEPEEDDGKSGPFGALANWKRQ